MKKEPIAYYHLPDQELLKSNLIDAIKKQKIKNIHDCLKAGAPVNMPAVNGRTALIEVCDPRVKRIAYHEKEGLFQETAINLLLIYGADPNYRDTFGLSALDYAAKNDLNKPIELLLNAGAQLIGNAPTTPCHLASYYQAYKALELLHRYNASMNELDKKGLAPLHHAVNRRGPVKELLAYGARLDLLTKPTSGNGRKCGGQRKYPAGSSAFHLAAHLHSCKCDNNGKLTMLIRTKTPLLYYALLYGTMNQKDALHFLCCIRQCAPGLYSIRNYVLTPYIIPFEPQQLRHMLRSHNGKARAIAAQALKHRAKQLRKLLIMRDADNQTAHHIELAMPIDHTAYAPLFDPEALEPATQEFIKAAQADSVNELPANNPFKEAYLCVTPEPKKKSILHQVWHKLKKPRHNKGT